MKKLFLPSAAIFIFSLSAHSQGLWQANGNNVVYSMRSVGIATSSPTQKLDVAGAVHSFNSYTDSLSQAMNMKAQIAEFKVMLALTAKIDNLECSDVIINGKLNANIINAKAYYLNGNPFPSNLWGTNPDGSIYFNGQVLVKRLDASEGISIGNFKFKNGAVPAPVQRDTISAPNKLVIESQTKAIELSADTVTMKEFVGIGKTPTSALDVAGDIKASGAVSADKISANSLQVQNEIFTSGNLRLSGLSGTGDRQVMVDANGNLKSGGSSTLGAWDLGGNANTNPDHPTLPNFLGTTDNAALAFRTNNTEQLRILPNGNIGIGTTTPQKRLHVFQSENPTCATTLRLEFEIPSPPVNGCGTPVNSTWDLTASGNNVFTITSPFLQTPAMTFSGNGNVGIGTTNPQQKLDVDGKAKFSDNVTIGTSSANANLNLNGDIEISGSRLHVDGTSGNVGIGTALVNNPNNYKLDVAGTVNAANYFKGGQPFANEWTTASNGADIYKTILGNVGIGTNNPASTLHIEGNEPEIRLNNTTTEAVNFVISSANGAARLISDKSVSIFIDAKSPTNTGQWFSVISNTESFTGGRELFRVDESGVTAGCRFKVLAITGCDFVFEPDYKRMTWQEKELFYTIHKRLPHGLDAAAAMENDGLDVGTNFTALLQNVEEDRLDITELYKLVTQQQEQINKLLKENEEMKKKK